MRLAAAEMPMAEMHEQRATYVARVREAAQEDLERNGLELESVAIVDIDQTEPRILQSRPTASTPRA